jgi:hypothetical protein
MIQYLLLLQEVDMPKGNKAGSVRGQYKTFEEKVMAKVSIQSAGYKTDCWIWQGRINAFGYGSISPTKYSKSKTTVAHRHVYEEKIGKVPEGKDLDHLCRNRSCVNPEHLEPVSRLENILRGELVALRVNPDFCKNGHPWVPENRIKSKGNATTCRLCNIAAKLKFRKSRGSLLAGMGTGAVQKLKTHCLRGHEFTEANTIVHPQTGFRRCRACHNERRRVSNVKNQQT